VFPEDTLAGKTVDGWGVDPGISIRTEKTGSESINNDNDGTGHIRGSAGYELSGSDQNESYGWIRYFFLIVRLFGVESTPAANNSCTQ